MNLRGIKVLVTGGLGFIGSNLAIRLVREGAEVTIVDPLLPGCGGNLHNIEPVRDQVQLLRADIAEATGFRDAIAASRIIFNLAGEISHIHSMQFPERDLQVNTVAQLRFLMECKTVNRGVRIIYAGTRQIYGVPSYLPVDENHPIQPVDFNGVHKFAATRYHLMLSSMGELDARVLRLTNVYGPRMALDVTCQGFLSTYLRRLILGQQLEIFGSGEQLRDPVYVDDAVEAFLAAARSDEPRSRSYNVGGPEALPLSEIARTAASVAHGPEPIVRPFPPERRAIDIGSYCTNSSRIERELGWKPVTSFREGVERTLAYYRAQLPHYLDPKSPEPVCKMPEHSGTPWRLTYAEV
ncbi:MAG: NAD-dependent epimerase/dehydratase family protein [Bryobacteraceae bacterium]